MPKLRLTFVAVATLASATSALALKTQMSESEHGPETQTFKCGPAEAGQNRIVAADLPPTVILSLMLSANKVTDFKVSYIGDDREKTDPAHNARSWHVVTMPSGRDFHWYATGGGQSRTLTHGRLFEQVGAREGEKRWLYYEEQFEAGLKTGDFQLACAKE